MVDPVNSFAGISSVEKADIESPLSELEFFAQKSIPRGHLGVLFECSNDKKSNDEQSSCHWLPQNGPLDRASSPQTF